jgi:serine/threonine kinase 32
VEFEGDQRLYALKYTQKDQAIKDKAMYHILQERRLLEDIQHPYICSLRFSFQDDTIMYMVLDFMPGGDLRAHIKNRKWTEVFISIIFRGPIF